MYTDLTLHTCGGSGSMGHYELDAQTYAHDWQIDYLKVPPCRMQHLRHIDPLSLIRSAMMDSVYCGRELIGTVG